MKLEVKVAKTQAEINSAKKTRSLVFNIEQGIPEEMEFDKNDDSSTHFIALFNNKVIGTARITIIEKGIAKGSRLAILKEYRNLNAGRLIMNKIKEIAIQLGINKIIIEPHNYLEKYYSHFGFKRIEGYQSFGDIKLIRMEIYL